MSELTPAKRKEILVRAAKLLKGHWEQGTGGDPLSVKNGAESYCILGVLAKARVELGEEWPTDDDDLYPWAGAPIDHVFRNHVDAYRFNDGLERREQEVINKLLEAAYLA